MGLGLRERGHEVVFATSEYYRAKIEGLGFELRALRPNVSPDDRELVALLMDIKKGSERVLRGIMFPHLRETYADLRLRRRARTSCSPGSWSMLRRSWVRRPASHGPR